MQYKILVSGNNVELTKMVQEKLDEGWELQGGVSASYAGMGFTYAQAMIRKAEGMQRC